MHVCENTRMQAGTCASISFCLLVTVLGTGTEWKQAVEVAANVQDAAGSSPVNTCQRRRLLETRAWVWAWLKICICIIKPREIYSFWREL